jgi:Flp pilus assembly protein TadG
VPPRARRRGAAAVEFSLAGIASIFLILFTFQVSMAMWNYHTLAYAAHEATRYISVKGVDCTNPGNTCSVTVGDIARKIDSLLIGVPDGHVNFTLTTDSGAATACAPLNSCYSNTTVWPPSTNSDNATGKSISVSAVYQFPNALAFFWPGTRTQSFGTITLSASSKQTIIY